MLVDIILLELIQHYQYKQLQEHLLPEELKRQPEQEIEWRGAVSSATAFCISRSGWEKHEEVPVLAWEVDE